MTPEQVQALYASAAQLEELTARIKRQVEALNAPLDLAPCKVYPGVLSGNEARMLVALDRLLHAAQHNHTVSADVAFAQRVSTEMHLRIAQRMENGRANDTI